MIDWLIRRTRRAERRAAERWILYGVCSTRLAQMIGYHKITIDGRKYTFLVDRWGIARQPVDIQVDTLLTWRHDGPF